MFRSYSAVGRDRRSCVLDRRCGYQAWLVHFGITHFFMAIPTEDGTTRGRGDRSRRRGRVRFCVNTLALSCFPRGVRWGLNVEAALRPPPNLRQRVECGSGTAASLDSLHLIRGVGAFYAAGTVREHSAVSWRCRQLPRRRLSASSPRAGTAPRPDNTPQPFRRRCTPHAQPARRRGSATAQRPRRTARLP